MREVEVWRGGHTHNSIAKEKDAYVWIMSGGAHAADERRGLQFGFSIPSKGGGKTSLKVWVGPHHFKEVLTEMLAADPVAFRKALAAVASPE